VKGWLIRAHPWSIPLNQGLRRHGRVTVLLRLGTNLDVGTGSTETTMQRLMRCTSVGTLGVRLLRLQIFRGASDVTLTTLEV
jgi:hypothetical protein